METLNAPLVSIISPAYNCAAYIGETIASVLAQTFSNWEMIIVDDCSSDDTYTKAKEASSNDPRIQIIHLETNGGCAKARNIGLSLARGQYIVFLDGDDLWDPTFLESQIAFMKEHGPLITASYRRKATNTTTDFIVPERCSYKSTLSGCALSCLTTMYDRSIFGERFFREDMRRNEDFAFWLSLLKEGYDAYGNPEVLATYRILQTSKSHNKIRYIKHMWFVYRRVEKLSFFYSIGCLIRWAIYGLKKYKGVR